MPCDNIYEILRKPRGTKYAYCVVLSGKLGDKGKRELTSKAVTAKLSQSVSISCWEFFSAVVEGNG